MIGKLSRSGCGLFLLVPSDYIIRLQRYLGEHFFVLNFSRADHEESRLMIDQGHTGADGLWVNYRIPFYFGMGLANKHFLDPRTIFRAEPAVITFWAKLIKAVPHKIVGARNSQEMAAHS